MISVCSVIFDVSSVIKTGMNTGAHPVVFSNLEKTEIAMDYYICCKTEEATTHLKNGINM